MVGADVVLDEGERGASDAKGHGAEARQEHGEGRLLVDGAG
jgi:hypothetical protein